MDPTDKVNDDRPGAEDFAAPFPKKVKASKTPKPGPGLASISKGSISQIR